MAKNMEQESTPKVNLLGSGTEIKGDISTNGDFRIDGTLKGTIVSKGKVVVGSTGKVEGEIKCQNGDFSGSIKAKVYVSSLLTLKSTATLSGDIVTNKLAIEPGAKFSGTCNMEDSSQKTDTVPLKNEPAKA